MSTEKTDAAKPTVAEPPKKDKKEEEVADEEEEEVEEAPKKTTKKAATAKKGAAAGGKKRAKKVDDDPEYKGGKSGKRGRGKPNASGYLVFVKENMSKVRAEHPEVKQKEIMSLVGKLWRETPEEEKEAFKRKGAAAAAGQPEAKKPKA